MKIINDPMHYFNKMLKNMTINDYKKRCYNAEHETLIEFTENDRLIIGISNEDNIDFGDWRNVIENECLFNALLSLNQKELILIRMWAIDGYTQKELAILMDISETAVRMRIKRIKSKMIKNFKEI